MPQQRWVWSTAEDWARRNTSTCSTCGGTGGIQVRKVCHKGSRHEREPADMMTKPLPGPKTEQLMKINGYEFVDMDKEALAVLVAEKLRRSWKVTAVKTPASGHNRKSMLQDLMAVMGAEIGPEEMAGN